MQSVNRPRFFHVLSAATLAAALSSPPATVAREVHIAPHTFTVPDGFTVERITTPNLVQRPISASFDDQGRLYVTDSSGTNEKQTEQLKNPTHRIVRLEDTDGDGTFDRSTVFADRLAFPEGCLWHQGSVYVAVVPNILKLTDTNGDGIADTRTEWYSGGVITGCANDVHGPYLGPDGRIYWTKGAFAQLNLIDGRGRPIRDRASHLFRARPDGAEFESIMTGGMDNPVEAALSREGESFFTTTFVDFTQPGNRDGLCHAVYGGVFGKQQEAIEDRLVKRTGELLSPLVQYGAGAPSGLCRFESSAWGSSHKDNLYATLFNLQRVTRHTLQPKGAGFATQNEDFLVSDNRDFHPTDVLEDPAGSLLVVDTGGWYKMCCPSSQLAKADVLGALYRVRKDSAPRIEDPYGKNLSNTNLRPEEWTARLSDPRPAVQKLASQSLVRLGNAALPALSQAASQEPTGHAALWTLSQIPTPEARVALGKALSEISKSSPRSESLLRTALRANALSLHFKTSPAVLSLFLSHLNNSDLHSRRAAIESLGRVRERSAVDEILQSLPGAPDRLLEHAAIYALIEIADPVATRRNLGSDHPQIRRAALLALDQMDGTDLQPTEIAPLLADPQAPVRDAAKWIVARHPEWGGRLAGWLRSRVELSTSPDERDEWASLFAQFASNEEVQQILGAAAQNPKTQQVALLAMSRASLTAIPALWGAAVQSALDVQDFSTRRAAISAARAFAQSKTNAVNLGPALLNLAANATVSEELRLAALAALPPGFLLAPEIFSFAASQLEPALPPLARSTAASILSRAQLNSPQRSQIAHLLKNAGPLELPKLLDSLAAAPEEPIGIAALNSLKDAKSIAALRPDTFQSWLNKFPPAVKSHGTDLLQRLNADASQQVARLEKIANELPKGDVRRGQSVFNSPKAACVTCHPVGYLGGKVGPDLTRIGEVRSERDLLESIVFPSASLVRSFETTEVVSRNGDLSAGILKRDDDRGVRLLTGPNTEIDIARADIAEIRPGKISLMPAGLDEQLSRQELADLIAFLKNTTWGPR